MHYNNKHKMDSFTYLLVEFEGDEMYIPFQDNYSFFIGEMAKIFNLPTYVLQNNKSMQKLFEIMKQSIVENKIKKFIIVKPNDLDSSAELEISKETLKNNLKEMIDMKLKEIGNKLFNELYPVFEKELERKYKEKETQFTYSGIQCQGCNIFPIEGIRYKCSVCKNFNYCAQCEEKYAEMHGHSFIKLNTKQTSQLFNETFLRLPVKKYLNQIEINQFSNEIQQMSIFNLKGTKKEPSFEILNDSLSYTTHNNNSYFNCKLSLKNTGNESWPTPLYLICEQGSFIKGNKVKISKEVQPDEIMNIQIKFDLTKLNKKTGKYKSIWKLYNEKRQCYINKSIEFELTCIYKSTLLIKNEFNELIKKPQNKPEDDIIDELIFSVKRFNDDLFHNVLPPKPTLHKTKPKKIDYFTLLKEIKKEISSDICPDDNTVLHALIKAGGNKEIAKKNIINKLR